MQKDKLFPAQDKSEKIVRVIRRHWFTYLIFWFLAFMMFIPFILVILYWIMNNETISLLVNNIIILGSSIYVLLILALLIYGFVDFYLDVYILTDKRVVDIKQNGLFKREISELNLRQVQDVNAEVNGVFATLLHYGDVYIQTAGEQENFVFRQIPHPYETSKNIIDLHERYLGVTRKGSTEQIKKDILPGEKADFTKEAENNSERYPDLLKGVDTTIREQNIEGTLKEGESVDLDETK